MTEKETASLIRQKRRLQDSIKDIDLLLGISSRTPWQLFRKMNTYEQGEYIISGICDFFEIKRKDFLKKTNIPNVTRRKNYALVIMSRYTELTQDYMGHLCGYTTHSNANHVLQKMDDSLSMESYGDPRMRAVYRSIIDYLGFPHDFNIKNPKS